MRVTRNGTSVDLVVIVLHLKAFSTYDDYLQRQTAAQRLKDYLDTQLPNERVIVLGDWNDDVDLHRLGLHQQQLSPHAVQVSSTTQRLHLRHSAPVTRGAAEQVSNSQFIDHQSSAPNCWPAT